MGIYQPISRRLKSQDNLERLEVGLFQWWNRLGQTSTYVHRFQSFTKPRRPLGRRRRSGLFRPSYAFSKRLFDLAICLLALPFVLPVIGAICLAIWLEDRGSPFFYQTRTGYGDENFRMWKFRTMVVNAEAMKQQLMHLNELQWPDFKIKNDPRMTKVGKFLRRSSLDELPQVFNVLKGDMSLVGPRPTSFSSKRYQSWQMERLEVKPGLTGLWQVSGRSDVEFDERVLLDIEYIEKQSFWLDLQILFRTFESVVRGHGAY